MGPMSLPIADRDVWTPERWHGRPPGAGSLSPRTDYLTWRVVDEGIEVAMVSGTVRRTKGDPTTLRRIIDDYADQILHWADVFGITEQVLAAVIAVESGGRPHAERHEAHLNDSSIGLTQTLTATASWIYHSLSGIERAMFNPLLDVLDPLPESGALEDWRNLLREPATAIGLGAAVLGHLDRALHLKGDPVLLYCGYNAGGVYVDYKTPWGLREYDPDGRGPSPGALDYFTRWYGDACAVYGMC